MTLKLNKNNNNMQIQIEIQANHLLICLEVSNKKTRCTVLQEVGAWEQRELQSLNSD